MLRRTGNRAGILILACMLAASPALAQITTGMVTGNVRDEHQRLLNRLFCVARLVSYP